MVADGPANPIDGDYMYEQAELYSVMSLSLVLKMGGFGSSGHQHAAANADSHPHVYADVPIHRHVRTWSLV